MPASSYGQIQEIAVKAIQGSSSARTFGGGQPVAAEALRAPGLEK